MRRLNFSFKALFRRGSPVRSLLALGIVLGLTVGARATVSNSVAQVRDARAQAAYAALLVERVADIQRIIQGRPNFREDIEGLIPRLEGGTPFAEKLRLVATASLGEGAKVTMGSSVEPVAADPTVQVISFSMTGSGNEDALKGAMVSLSRLPFIVGVDDASVDFTTGNITIVGNVFVQL